MTRTAVAFIALIALTTGVSVAQDASHGGGSAVNPGGATAAQQGAPESKAQQHAEDAAKHGEGHEEAPMPNETLWKWANFAILAAGLGYLIQKNAGPYFQSRSEEISKDIAESTRTRKEAEARAGEIENRVRNLSAEVDRLKAQSREELAREGERIRSETEAHLHKIQARAESEIETASRLASHDLKAYSAQLALQLAERQLTERMSSPVQDELTGSFISSIRQKAARN